jgi:hypothetical protein
MDVGAVVCDLVHDGDVVVAVVVEVARGQLDLAQTQPSAPDRLRARVGLY